MEGTTSRKRKQADICLQKTTDEYTVGWICAICTEYTAAQAALDEEHERPDYIAPGDHNDYTVGCIGKHNVVITVLPYGEYGTDSAALVARDMLHSFANIKVGLMVGVGGGAPSERHDIRLGDIVVSAPCEGQSGVLQYDFGKMVQGEPFQQTRLLNQSPRILRSAVNGLKSQYQRKGYDQLRKIIDDVLERNPSLQREFGRPDVTSDRLYRSEIIHPTDGVNTQECSDSCGDDPSKLVVRPKRIADESAPVVHYGLIASANTLMKDAVLRDKLALEKNIICFEMEAAGLMNQFPCLVVRGICDYSDSHKNKQWQGYAAVAAAAYAKDLLHRISSDNNSALQRVIGEEKSQIPSDSQKQALLKSLKFDHHRDRYDYIKTAHAETCIWLQESVQYLDWLDPAKIHDHHGFLWIKGKPGAGKSTIMKFALVTARKSLRNRIVISFFFNARGDVLEKSTLGMYRSLLLQLLQQLPAIQDKLDLSDFIANHDTFYRWHVEPLKSLFHQAIENIQKSKVVCFIDAMDECAYDEVRDMISFFKCLGDLATSKGISFLVCFSSRHYPYISIQNGLSLTLENQKEHAHDIVKYVRSELKIGQDIIANRIHADIPKKSRGVFMWVILVVLILNKEYEKGRLYQLETKYQEIPVDLHKLFKDILTRNFDENPKETLRCLQWILFAERPLAPEELYSVVLSDVLPTWAHPEISEHDIQRFILNSSLGFADIILSDDWYMPKTVQFIHESVKDFLLKDNGLREIWMDLSGDFHGQSHEELKQRCVIWISMGSAICSQDSSSEKRTTLLYSASKELPFLDYAVLNVLYHADEAQKYGISQAGFIKEFEANIWIMIRSSYQGGTISLNSRLLYILAELNMSHLVGCHPSKLAFSEVGSEIFGTPLFAALANGSNEAILEFLKAQAESTPEFYGLYEEYRRKPLDLSHFRLGFTFSRSENIISHFTHPDEGNMILQVAFLLNMHSSYASWDWQRECTQSPFLYVYCKGNKALLGVLVERCINQPPAVDYALFNTVAKKGDEDSVELLLQKSAKIDARYSGRTALHCAVRENRKDAVQLLIKAGANIEACEERGDNLNTAKLPFLMLPPGRRKRSAKARARDSHGYTPLLLAAMNGYKDVVVLLLESKANIEARSSHGYTPLSFAAMNGYKAIVVLLLENGCEIEAKDNDGKTPLILAARGGRRDIVVLLLEKGANIEEMDGEGQTPLLWAVRDGNEDVVTQLLEKGSNIEVMNKSGQTPLGYAIRRRHDGMVIRLLEKGLNLEAIDENGQTPLMWAIRNRSPSLVRLLLNRGAKIPTRKVANVRPKMLDFFEKREGKVRVDEELTLLEFAGQFEEMEIIELLAENGAT